MIKRLEGQRKTERESERFSIHVRDFVGVSGVFLCLALACLDYILCVLIGNIYHG